MLGGLNDPRKQKRLKLALKKFRVNIICLIETHVKLGSCPAMLDFVLP